MIHTIKTRILLAFTSFLLVGLFVPGYGFAADAGDASPLTFWKGENNSHVKGTISVEAAYFNQGSSWFGESKANLGRTSDEWWETTIRPGLEGSYFFESAGEMYGRFDAVGANTEDIDAAGSNADQGDVSKMRVEESYVGWRSGDLFSSLGKDFLDISFGRQQYVVGNGFLFYSQSSNGAERGAYWIGDRHAADYAGIIRLRTGGWAGDLVYFKADDNPNSDTKLGGATLDYSFDKAGGVGGGFYYIDSDIDSRDEMLVYNIRGTFKPFEAFDILPALKPFTLEAEYVYENTDDDSTGDGNGWYISAGYQFDVPWKPDLTYRYSYFDKDYDPLFYGFSDWGYWYQGEVLGEYVLSNSNLKTHMVKLNVTPVDSLSVNLFYYNFRLDDADAFGVDDEEYADEAELIVDYSFNDHLSFSFVGAYVWPDDGAKQQTGGNDDWAYMMTYAKFQF